MEVPPSTPPSDPVDMARLERLGITPRMLARMERVREMQRASGLSPEEFRAEAMRRVEQSQKKLEEMKQGWNLPIMAGFVGVLLAQSTWLAFTQRSLRASLFSIVGTSIIVVLQFDRDLLPPRRRMIGGLLIGGALAGLLMLSLALFQ